MFQVIVENSEDPVLNILQTDPDQIFRAAFAGYILLLFGAADEEIATWFTRSLVALDSLTGGDIACAVFARRVRIASTRSSYPASPSLGLLGSEVHKGEVKLDTVRRTPSSASTLVQNGTSLWPGGERDITAVTYAADDVARAFGVIDKLPCMIFLDASVEPATADTSSGKVGYDVVSLRDYRPNDIIPILREAIQTLRSHPSFASYSRDLRDFAELQDDIARKTSLAESVNRQLHEISQKRAASQQHDIDSLKAAHEALMNGSRKHFRRHLEAISIGDPTVHNLMTLRMDAEYRELGALNKTINTLNWYGSHEKFDDLLQKHAQKVFAHVQSFLTSTEFATVCPVPDLCLRLATQLEAVRSQRISHYEQNLPTERQVEAAHSSQLTAEVGSHKARLGEIQVDLNKSLQESIRLRSRIATNIDVSLTEVVREVIASTNRLVNYTRDKDPVFDFFLAHAGPDENFARRLYQNLAHHARVFLAAECLMPGDNWDVEIPRAQSRSRITIALLSSATPDAYYQCEEIATAIHESREGHRLHRIVPVYLPHFSDEWRMPYGLRRTHGLWWRRPDDVDKVTSQLLALRSAI